MHRQPFGNAKFRENAQLPETFPIVKDASKDFSSVRKRKERAAGQDLRVQVLQEQAKRPAQAPRSFTEAEGTASESKPVPAIAFQNSTADKSPFQGLPKGATSFTGLAELVASDRSIVQADNSGNLSRLVSFDDLSAQLDSHSRQSGVTRFAAPPRFSQNAADQAAGALTTFEDIATRQEVQEEDHEGLHHTFNAVTRLKSVAISEDIKSRDSFSRKPSRAQPESLPGRQSLTDLSSPCIDLSLKTRALFFSQQPFDVCREAISLPASQASSAASGFAGHHELSDSLAQRLQRALMTWQHPSAAMPAAAIAAVAASKQGAELLDQRKLHWQEAFRSLYMAVQCGACHCFYFMSPQDAKKPFVAYFGAAGTLGRPRMHAWVSRSTHGLRERLRAEPHGLVFSTPLAPSADVRFRDERMQAELMEASQSCAPSPSVRSDDKAASLLYFDGRPQAHGLFDFLLHEVMLSEAVDVPTLLAPVPFIGATLHQHIPQVLPLIGSRRDGERKRGAHKMELKGMLPPWVLDRLCHVLEVSQQGELQVLLDTHSGTAAFNLSHAEEMSAQENAHTVQRSSDQASEWQRWRSIRPCITGLLTRELCCKDGLYSAEMEPMQ